MCDYIIMPYPDYCTFQFVGNGNYRTTKVLSPIKEASND